MIKCDLCDKPATWQVWLASGEPFSDGAARSAVCQNCLGARLYDAGRRCTILNCKPSEAKRGRQDHRLPPARGRTAG